MPETCHSERRRRRGTPRENEGDPSRSAALGMTLCPWMKLIIDLLQPRPRDMRVDLRGGDVRMAKHQLDGSEIRSVLQEMRGERMSQNMGRDMCLDAGQPCVLDDLHPERLAGHRAAA